MADKENIQVFKKKSKITIYSIKQYKSQVFIYQLLIGLLGLFNNDVYRRRDTEKI
jgi:hypothetical protein